MAKQGKENCGEVAARWEADVKTACVFCRQRDVVSMKPLNHTIQRMRASRFAQSRIGSRRRLALTADGGRWARAL